VDKVVEIVHQVKRVLIGQVVLEVVHIFLTHLVEQEILHQQTQLKVLMEDQV
tara:strand:- start:137 stop:292 length:156 start_codon:yes stop_codon:yes gene_type:complete